MAATLTQNTCINCYCKLLALVSAPSKFLMESFSSHPRVELSNLPSPTSCGEGADRIGVAASVLCAIHCAATPALLLFAPTLGETWVHPASHWIAALLVVPLALAMVLRGFRIHRERWIVAVGLLGMTLIIAGAIIPYLPDRGDAAEAKSGIASAGEAATEQGAEEDFVWIVGEETESDTHVEGCADACCPSLVTGSEGNTKLHVPPASVVTTLGGIALICTHLGNLCACRKQKADRHCESPFC